MEEPKSCPLSAQRSRSPIRDYRPTFRDGKHYQFVPEPTIQHYKKMKDSRDISCTSTILLWYLNLAMVSFLLWRLLVQLRTKRCIKLHYLICSMYLFWIRFHEESYFGEWTEEVDPM